VADVAFENDVDALLATRPTHLVVNIDENRRDTFAALHAHIPKIVVTHPLVPEDNLELYREFGRLFDRGSAAESLAAKYCGARDALARMARKVRPLGLTVVTVEEKGLYKVRVGEYPTREAAQNAAASLKSRLGGSPFVVAEP